MPPNRRVTSPRLALLRTFVATLLVATTLFGVRAAVSHAAISLPPNGVTGLPSAAPNEPLDESIHVIRRSRYGRLLGAGPVSSSGRAPDF
jgi:hypothetical protein